MKYNPWPLGEIPKHLQRPEPEQIREIGYVWDDPRDIVDIFERKVAEFAGSRYAVAVDSCSHAIFLTAKYKLITLLTINWHGKLKITIPRNTYVSVKQQLLNAGFKTNEEKIKWKGIYQIKPLEIYDAALRWTEGMYIEGSLMCLSFQYKKRIPIGRGGMILCDDPKEYKWFKLARHDGRDLRKPYDHKYHVQMNGWHFYMTPEDAARGIILMDNTPKVNKDQGGWKNYPPLR
jgi:dTDP-4-amino-4,6-dideoxygalactose transaminase